MSASFIFSNSIYYLSLALPNLLHTDYFVQLVLYETANIIELCRFWLQHITIPKKYQNSNITFGHNQENSGKV